MLHCLLEPLSACSWMWPGQHGSHLGSGGDLACAGSGPGRGQRRGAPPSVVVQDSGASPVFLARGPVPAPPGTVASALGTQP